jgi:hypothetical protein
MTDDEIEERAEWQVKAAAELVAKSAAPIWRFGDGSGGVVVKLVLEACAEEGLTAGPTPPRPRPMTEILAERDGWECHYCQHPLGWGHWSVRAPEVEHKVPKALGGVSRPENLVLACSPCNLAKGVSLHDDFCRRCPS